MVKQAFQNGSDPSAFQVRIFKFSLLIFGLPANRYSDRWKLMNNILLITITCKGKVKR